MKQIKVNEKCNGCGLCVVNCTYLEENSQGNAQAISGKSIKSEDEIMVQEVIKECPVGALELVEIGTNKIGKAGIKDVINELKSKCSSFSLGKVSCSDVRLNIKDYQIDVPYSSKERRREYTSEGSAKSAARDEFNRLCYSETAYRPMIKKIFVEYKVNVLKPYYICVDKPESAYYEINETVRKYLADAYAQIVDLIGEGKISETWKSFSVYPTEKDWCIQALKEFDERSTNSGIISTLKDLSNTSLNDYVTEMDFDYDEEYAGEGLFGKAKYKNMYYFYNFDSAAKSYINDLTWAIGHMSTDIEEGAVEQINSIYKKIEEQIKVELSKKIDELNKLL